MKLKYVGRASSWHVLQDDSSGNRYLIRKPYPDGEDLKWVFPAGYVIWGREVTFDPELRKQIILTAWPLVDAS